MAETSGGQAIPMKDKLDAIHNEYEKLSAEGYRVLGVAYKKIADAGNFTRADENNMIFLGLLLYLIHQKKMPANNHQPE